MGPGRKVIGVVVGRHMAGADLDPLLQSLWQTGAQVILVGPDLAALEAFCLDGSRPLSSGITFAAARAAWFDALLIVGGAGASRVQADPQARALLSAFTAAGHPVAAVGTGVGLLLTTGRAAGRRLASPASLAGAVAAAGARRDASSFCQDGAWITCSNGAVDRVVNALLAAIKPRARPALGA